ncbi:MAG: hypothetical protein IPQ07_25220 [Myxococcales bacterium]|nr:hypothetical protein [Myxococcales bacterium]
MKSYTLLLAGLILAGCDGGGGSANDLGGDPDIPLTTVGNEYSAFVTIGGVNSGANFQTVKIIQSDAGVVTVKLVVDLTNVNPLYKAFIPADRLDANGNVNTELKFKATSEGLQDYFYGGGDLSKPFTIVKHDWGVGESWTFTTSDGQTVTRAVTQKTGVDDWPLGFLLIKATEVTETDSAVPGVQKVLFRTNHRFGLVYVEYQLVGGTIVKISLIPPATL